MRFYHYTYLPLESHDLVHIQQAFEKFKVQFNMTDPDNEFTLHLTGPQNMVDCDGTVYEAEKYLKVSWTTYMDVK